MRHKTKRKNCIQYYNLRLFIFVFISNLYSLTAFSQQLKFETHWDSKLVSNTIEDILQDELGFIWVATQGGLVRYDGYSYVNYQHDINNNKSLDDNLIRDILPAENHQLWVGTMAGVNLFNPKTEEFKRYSFQSKDSNVYLGVTSLVEYQGKLLIGSENGLFHLNEDNQSIQPYLIKPFNSNSYHSITQLLVTNDQQLFLATKEKLYKFNQKTNGFNETLSTKDKAIIVDVFEDESSKIWVRWSSGLIQILHNGELSSPVLESSIESSIAGYFPSWQAIIQPNPDEVWIGTNLGVSILDAHTGMSKPKRIHAPGAVKSLMIDQSGLIWAGIDGDGLGKHIPQNEIQLFQQGLKISSIGAVSEVKDKIWIGTRGAGIYQLHRNSGSLNHIDIANLTIPPSDGFIRDILVANGHVWIATNNAGILKLDLNGNLIEQIDKSKGMPSNQTFSLAKDSNENVWVGTLDSGLAIIEKNSNIVSTLKISDSPTLIINIVITPQDTVFLGTPSGLVRIDHSKVITKYMKDLKDPNSLVGDFISNLFLDSKQRLWIGTRDGLGLLATDLDADNFIPEFKHIQSDQFNLDIFIDAVLEGNNNDVWIALGTNLIQYNLDENKLNQFGISDGVPQSGYWVGSHQLSQNKTMMFATKKGVLFVDPNAKNWDYQPKTLITQVENGQQLSRNPWIDELIIAPEDNSFSLEFSALDYSAPLNNRYAYQLVGFDKDWKFVDSTHRVATYTNLDPGTYEFQVKGSNRNHQWNENISSIDIIVKPDTHETLWFKLFILLLIIALVYLVIQWRTKQIKIAKRTLESLIQERTKDLSALNFKLEQSSKTDFLTTLPNRYGFFQITESYFSKYEKADLCIAICDIDDFKQFNDTYGHSFGDFILKEFALYLRKSIRNQDIVARWGGEEFTMIFPSVSLESAHKICLNLLNNLKQKSWHHNDIEFQVSATFGVSKMENGMTLDDCINNADIALYKGKNSGKATVVVAS